MRASVWERTKGAPVWRSTSVSPHCVRSEAFDTIQSAADWLRHPQHHPLAPTIVIQPVRWTRVTVLTTCNLTWLEKWWWRLEKHMCLFYVRKKQVFFDWEDFTKNIFIKSFSYCLITYILLDTVLVQHPLSILISRKMTWWEMTSPSDWKSYKDFTSELCAMSLLPC